MQGFTHKKSNAQAHPMASPIPEEDMHFEYDSDSIEKYDMISNEFDFENIRRTD